MSFGGGGGPMMMMQPPPLPDAPPTPPSFASQGVQGAGAAQKNRSGGGLASTILTSGQGDLLPANTGKKTLLGQ